MITLNYWRQMPKHKKTISIIDAIKEYYAIKIIPQAINWHRKKIKWLRK